MTNQVISVAEAARQLGLTPIAAYKRIERTGRLHPMISTVIQDGRRLYVSRFEVEDAVLAQARRRS